MDKIEQYKNLNEQVNRLLTKEMATTLNEQVASAAQELVEALDDANKVTQLMRAGLVDSGRVSRVRNALKDPEKAMKNPSVRSDLINMLMSLVNIITSNPTAFSTVRKKAKEMAGASEEPVTEELSPKQKKIDLNKNKKIDGEDLQMLRKKGDGMYEDLQTQARFDEFGKKITKAGARGGNAIRAKDYAERNSKKIYDKGGKVVSRKKGVKYHGVPKFERKIIAYNKANFPDLNQHP